MPVPLANPAAPAPPAPPAAPEPPAAPAGSTAPTAPAPPTLAPPAPAPPTQLSNSGAAVGRGPADAVLGGVVPAGTPTGARTAGVTSEAPVAASGGGVGVGGWLSANGWCPVASDVPNEQPLIPETAGADPNVQRAAVRRALRLEIRRVARSAASRTVAAEYSRITPPTAASAAEAQAGGSTTDGIDCASEPAADGAPSVAVSGGGTNPYAAMAGPGIWGWPFDSPAAPNDQQPMGRRSRTGAAPVVIRGVRDGAAAHLQDAADFIKEEWHAVEPSTIAHCWVKSTILQHALETDVIALHGEYRASSRSLGSDVILVVSLMSGCRFGDQALREDSEPVWEMAVQSWLMEEDNEEVRAATADRIVLEKGGGGDGVVDNGIEDPSDSNDE